MKKIFYGLAILFGILLIGSFSIQESYAFQYNTCRGTEGNPIVIDTIRHLIINKGIAVRDAFNFDEVVTVTNGLTNKVITTLTDGKKITDIGILENSGTVYITISEETSINYFKLRDLNSNSFNESSFQDSMSVDLEGIPDKIGVNQNLGKLYVTIPASNFVKVIKENKIIEEIKLPYEPTSIAIDSEKNLVYILFSNTSSIMIIDSSTDEIIDEIIVSFQPKLIAIDNSSSLIYLSDFDNDLIHTISTQTKKEISEYEMTHTIRSLTINHNTGKLYATDCNNNAISIIDLKQNITNETVNLNVNGSPLGIAVDSSTNVVYVSGFYPGILLTLDGSTEDSHLNLPQLPKIVSEVIWYGDSKIGTSKQKPESIIWYNEGLWGSLSNDIVDYLQKYTDISVEKRVGKISSLDEAKLLIITEDKQLTPNELFELDRFVSTGGRLIIAPSGDEKCEFMMNCYMTFSRIFGFGFDAYERNVIKKSETQLSHSIWQKPYDFSNFRVSSTDVYVSDIFDTENVKVLATASSMNWNPFKGRLFDESGMVLNEDPRFNGGKVLGISYDLLMLKNYKGWLFFNILDFMLEDTNRQPVYDAIILEDKLKERYYGLEDNIIRRNSDIFYVHETRFVNSACLPNESASNLSLGQFSHDPKINIKEVKKLDERTLQVEVGNPGSKNIKYSILSDCHSMKNSIKSVSSRETFGSYDILFLEMSQKQMRDNMDAQTDDCREELQRIFKSTDNSPVCVTPKTAEKLIQRGWANP